MADDLHPLPQAHRRMWSMSAIGLGLVATLAWVVFLGYEVVRLVEQVL